MKEEPPSIQRTAQPSTVAQCALLPCPHPAVFCCGWINDATSRGLCCTSIRRQKALSYASVTGCSMGCRSPKAVVVPILTQEEGLPDLKLLGIPARARQQEQLARDAPSAAPPEPELQQAAADAVPLMAEASPRQSLRSPQTAMPPETFPAAPLSAESAWLGTAATCLCSVHTVLLQPRVDSHPSCPWHVRVQSRVKRIFLS
jgi:hypothetical protein